MYNIKRQNITHLFILLFIVTAVSCKRQPVSLMHEYSVLTYDYLQLSKVLEKAYEKNSQALLDTFFTTWNKLLPAYSSNEAAAQSDTIYHAYKVFQEYYSPLNLSRLTDGQHETFKSDFRYLVVQNKLRIAVADTNPRFYYHYGVTVKETLDEYFRPKINIQGMPSVFLSPATDLIIYFFLFNPDSSLREDYHTRSEFLDKAMQMINHHWIRDIFKITTPNASSITFNKSFTKALVHFRVFYQFGEAYLERKNGDWKLIDSKLTAIE